MMGLSKPFYLKLSILAILSLIFISTPIYAQEDEPYTLFNKSKKTMKSRSWNNSKPEEKTEEASKDKSETKEEETKEETELTEDQKLWKKYKDLAEGYGRDYEDKEDSENIEQTKNAENEDDKTTKGSSAGIQAIIENYKKSQESKGKMHSRSFGKID